MAVVLARRAETVLRFICTAAALLAAVAAAVIVGLIGASVAMRHLALSPLRYTEELVGLLVSAVFLLALPLVTLRADHVRVQLLVASLPSRLRRQVSVVAALLGAAFCLWVLYLTLPWLDFAVRREIKSEVARLLLYPWMALLPLSMALTAAAFVIRNVLPAESPGKPVQ